MIATFAKKYCDDYRQYANLIRAQERDSLSRLNWEFSLDSKLMRGRDGNIVVLQQLRVFEGGLSATEYTFARNIEPKSLKLLSLNDLFTADDRKDLTADFVRQLTGMYDCDGLDQLRQKGILVDTEPYLSGNFYITDPERLRRLPKGKYKSPLSCKPDCELSLHLRSKYSHSHIWQ